MFKGKVTFSLVATLALRAGLVYSAPAVYAHTSKNTGVIKNAYVAKKASVVKKIIYQSGKLPKRYQPATKGFAGSVTVSIYSNGLVSLSGHAATLPPTSSNKTGGQANTTFSPNLRVGPPGGGGVLPTELLTFTIFNG